MVVLILNERKHKCLVKNMYVLTSLLKYSCNTLQTFCDISISLRLLVQYGTTHFHC